jgi:hypothetical protein
MNTHTLTQDQLAEQAGGVEMCIALRAMQQADTQGERLHILQDALCGIFESNNPMALAGATVAMIAALDRGLQGVTL